jgi:hypothetical protein
MIIAVAKSCDKRDIEMFRQIAHIEVSFLIQSGLRRVQNVVISVFCHVVCATLGFGTRFNTLLKDPVSLNGIMASFDLNGADFLARYLVFNQSPRSMG